VPEQTNDTNGLASISFVDTSDPVRCADCLIGVDSSEMRLWLLMALVLLAAPSVAQASTAKVVFPSDSGSAFSYIAAPGETNQVEVSLLAGTVTIRDTGASITAGDGCVSVDAHEVTCAVGIHDQLGVALDDLGDSLTLEGDGVDWDVRGGDGADTLVDSCPTGCGFLSGGPGDDTLQGRGISGGAGDDTLTGSPKGDSIGGGPGNDTLSGAGGYDMLLPAAGDDTVDGGVGRDTVWFSALPPTGVTADLRTGVATGDGTDTLTGVESLIGSSRGDHFSGDWHANSFDGQGGDDVLIGRGGADKLDGYCCLRGNDRLYGGPGRDRLWGGRGNDVLRGGTGVDRLRGQNGDDRLRAKDGLRDDVVGGLGFDRARVDPIDIVSSIEAFF
jgi:Ca2+-binding RTX toxin-like protein